MDSWRSSVMFFDTPKKTLESVCSLITDGSHFSPIPQEEGHPIVNAKDIPKGYIDLNSCTRISKKDWELLKKQNCAPKQGDVLLSKDGTIGRVVFYNNDLGVVVLSSVAILRPKNYIHPHFLSYLLRSESFSRQLKFLESGSALRRIILKDIKSLEFTFPECIKEQTKIAEILSTIDDVIKQTEELIAKQQRIKTGLMQDLLTRGIDKKGNLRSEETHQFKDSPLGRIPVEWDVITLGQVSEVRSGVTLGKTHVGPRTIELPYLRVANVQDGFLDLSDVYTLRVPVDYVDKYKLDVGDVLMNEGGDFDKLGRGTVWRGKISCCLHQNHVFRVRPQFETLSSDFLAAVSASPYGKSFFVLASKQSTNLASINSTQVKSFPIPLPDFDEQVRIEEVINRQVLAADNSHNQLAKLRSLKTALMQDLLTGKKRVIPLLESAVTN